MARPRKRFEFEPPGLRSDLRGQFIRAAEGSLALHQLCADVLPHWSIGDGLHGWADSFNVSGTWVEEWAVNTLNAWSAANAAQPVGSLPWWIQAHSKGRFCPAPMPAFPLPDQFEDMDGILTLSIRMLFDPWRGWLDDDEEVCPICRTLLVPVSEAAASIPTFCPSCHKTRKITIPSDRDLKVECCADYVMNRRTVEEVAKGLESRGISTTAMHKWIKATMTLLDLPMKPARRRSIN
jgi:hypothetical protein